jgi:hypothetical protein
LSLRCRDNFTGSSTDFPTLAAVGLTLHYKAHLPHATPAQARAVVVALHRHAVALAKHGKVNRVHGISRRAEDLDRFAVRYLTVPHPDDPDAVTGVSIAPIEGSIFPVVLGQGCEPLWLGLCRYPATVARGEGSLRTRLGGGWRMHCSCKTQHAGRHGWEHFHRCHTTAIGLIREFAALGVAVRIVDEGGWWPRRSDTTLRRTLAEHDGLLAALAGALKDAADETGAPITSVASPIFAHPQFERLEAEGASRLGEQIAEAVRRVTKETRPG